VASARHRLDDFEEQERVLGVRRLLLMHRAARFLVLRMRTYEKKRGKNIKTVEKIKFN
jgi:hypothetical protein